MQFNFRHQLQPLLELRPERTHIAVNVAAPAHLIEPDNTSSTMRNSRWIAGQELFKDWQWLNVYAATKA